ncbi:hypothetical protein SISNIDRAFT_489516 [Sistotremastrum niveocremeum HHB9708]|uniref:F-box domain-containing protein n=1 Tax=Sistotremastrum niveocremeum HHB9708 TaxID=1314777 RepID=A0A164PVJ2_9AGAM|nr:hypothetical protein SISNIDRAFT_489516 [Sistotremastrum niveocremeum HHB9708]
MPAELLVKCMEGLSVQDVVNIAQVDSHPTHWLSLNNRDLQTCSVLRQLVLANKAIICSTWNLRYTVQLPLASNFQTITAEQLFENAVKAMALSRHFAQSTAPLEPLLDNVYEYPSMTIEERQKDSPRFFGSQFSHLFSYDTILSFYQAGVQYILKLRKNGSIERHAAIRINNEDLESTDMDYHLSLDGLSLFVASCVVLRGDGLRSYSFLVSVTEISLAEDTFGHATYHFRLDINDLYHDPVGVTLCDPFMAVGIKNGTILLINWRDKTGTIIENRVPSYPFYRETDITNWRMSEFLVHMHPITMVFHPEDKTLIFLAELHPTLKDSVLRLYACDLPTDLQLIPNISSHASLNPHDVLILTPGSTGMKLKDWPVQDIEPRYLGLEIPLSQLCALGQSQSNRFSLNFKAVAPSTWVLDVSIVGKAIFRPPTHLSKSESHQAQPPVLKLFSSHITFDPATSKHTKKSLVLYVDLLDAHGWDWKLGEIATVRGRDFHQVNGGRASGDKAMMCVPKMEDGNGHGSSWLQMHCPDSFLQHLGSPWSGMDGTIFDKVTGRLYVMAHKKLRVIQY